MVPVDVEQAESIEIVDETPETTGRLFAMTMQEPRVSLTIVR